MSEIIAKGHDVLDRAGVYGPEAGLYPPLVERIRMLVSQRDEAVAEVKRLRAAIALMAPPMCENLHHEKHEYHGLGPCPVEQRIRELIGNAAGEE